MHALTFGFRWIRCKFPCARKSSAYGHSGFHWKFLLFLAFLNGFLELLIIWINEIGTSQLSRIVELRFLDSPPLLVLSLSCL